MLIFNLLSFGRSFCNFWLSFWLIFTKLISVLCFDGFFHRCFVPVRKFNSFSLQDISDTVTWTCAIFKIKLNTFLIKGSFVSMWVIVADLFHNVTRKWMTLGFLDD